MEYERSFRWPALTLGVRWLLIANSVVFFANAILVGVTQNQIVLAEWFGVSAPNLVEFYGLGVLRLLTYQFVHAFMPPGHFLFNMLVLYFFGTMVEGGVGRRRFLALYLTGGALGALVEVGLALLVGGRSVPVIGASGACYAVMIYAACMNPRMIVYLIVFPVQLRVLAWLLVGLGVYELYGNLVLGGGGGVAHGCHLGGALWGYVAYRYRIEPARLLDRFAAWQARRTVASRAADQETLDRLLEKVHGEGLKSLTPAERRFLDRRSRDLRGR